MNPRSSHTHCQVAQAVTKAKTWQRVYLPHTEKIELKNFPSPSENKKYATTQSDTTMTQKLNNDNGLQERTIRTTGYNSTYPKGGVSCSKDSLVVNQKLVFQIKFCSKSPALRVAANRYRQV